VFISFWNLVAHCNVLILVLIFCIVVLWSLAAGHVICCLGCVSWKSRVLGFGHAELDIGDADTAEIARLYRGHIPVL
jgi:hypothetical protein